MGLPERVRVKLSSEAAGAISMTPVVVQEMQLLELLEQMLGVVGKDPARIRELIARGTLVVGASRYRWTGWDADEASLIESLGSFPDADPSRPFAAGKCVRAVLRGGGRTIVVPREAGARRKLFRRANFWDVLMDVARERPDYGGYSYKERADCYLKRLDASEAGRLRAAAELVVYTTVRDQIRLMAVEAVELYVER